MKHDWKSQFVQGPSPDDIVDYVCRCCACGVDKNEGNENEECPVNHLADAARFARECELSLRMAMEQAEPITALFLAYELNVMEPVAERLGTLAQLSGEQEASEFKSVVCRKCGQKGLVFPGSESFVCHVCNEMQVTILNS